MKYDTLIGYHQFLATIFNPETPDSVLRAVASAAEESALELEATEGDEPKTSAELALYNAELAYYNATKALAEASLEVAGEERKKKKPKGA